MRKLKGTIYLLLIPMSLILLTFSVFNYQNIDLSKLNNYKSIYTEEDYYRSIFSIVNHNYTYPFVKNHIDSFKRDMIKYNKYNRKIETIKIQIDYSLGNYTAICNPNVNTMYINPVKYNMMSWQMKRYLIYHELGHCIYNLAHHHHGIMSYNTIDNPLLLMTYSFENQVRDFFTSDNIKTIDDTYVYKSKVVQEFMDCFAEYRNAFFLFKRQNLSLFFKGLNMMIKTQFFYITMFCFNLLLSILAFYLFLKILIGRRVQFDFNFSFMKKEELF